MKILNLKLVISSEYQNINTFSQKAMFQIGLKKLLLLQKLKILPCDLKSEEIVGTFYKKELQKANQKAFRAEKR